jgi:5-formyltetrahydrofolate cyclo-ligase
MAMPHAAQELLAHFQTLQLPPAKIIAGYAAIKDEINPEYIMRALASGGYHLSLPVLVAETAPLIFRAYQIDDVLDSENNFRLPQPTADKPTVTPDILLVPLLGFDRRGNRIGYGQGYYDRTLATLRSSNAGLLAIGLAYAEQEVPGIVPQPHDQPLNIIVTSREVIYCSAL